MKKKVKRYNNEQDKKIKCQLVVIAQKINIIKIT